MALVCCNCAVVADVDSGEHVEHSYNLYIASAGNVPEEAEAQNLTLEDLRLLRDEIRKSINLEKMLKNENSVGAAL